MKYIPTCRHLRLSLIIYANLQSECILRYLKTEFQVYGESVVQLYRYVPMMARDQ